MSETTNRLANETSPYLLQHRHNPVDWHPWGPEAFAAARTSDRPIFLSVGYSTCYWCHVMERESFESPATAAVMNQLFVCIKVDREERPDVDQLYMTAVQVLTRQGGWPMSVFLTPDLRPFYGGTYFPPTDHGSRPGFVSLLREISDAYKNRRDQVEHSANQVSDILRQASVPDRPRQTITLDKPFIERLVARSESDYDPASGGFGSAPKFPRQSLLELLLVYNRINPDDKRMARLRHTLDSMANGGIRDQLGGGFHRYSTDADWLVPHFEIMLYDNATLAWCYIEAYRQTEDRRYAAVARGIFDFVLREMTSPDGAFYTAFDAEVDAREGLTYLWTRAEVEATLAEALGDAPDTEARIHKFCRVYGLDDGPNFADPHHGNGLPDQNILFLADPVGDNVPSLLDPDLARLRELLLAARSLRKQPLLDTKIITSWNALMIRALAFGGQVLNDRRYLDAADKAMNFIVTAHRTRDDGLYRTSRDGVTKYEGFLDDYAFTLQAMIGLADNGGSERWKDAAVAMCKVMHRKFAAETGGFFFSEAGADDLIVRQMVGTDSPLPSGNGIAAITALSLKQPDVAMKTIAAFAAPLQSQAEGMSSLLLAAATYLRDFPPIVVEPASVAKPATDAEIVRLSSEWTSPTTLRIGVTVAAGFHINPTEPPDGLIATKLTVTGSAFPPIEGIDYPPATSVTLAEAESAIPVFDGEFSIGIRFTTPASPGTELEISLAYQACDDRSCRRPTVARLSVRV